MDPSMPKLIFAQAAHVVESWAVPQGQVVGYSNVRPESPVNEDSAAIIPIGKKAIVLAVADGAGGMRQGQQASKVAIETIYEYTKRFQKDEATDLRGYIIDAFEEANRKILHELNGGGTTLAVVEIVGTRMRPYHVGDSMILVIGQRGLIKFRSTAHSPVGYALQSGLVNEQEAMQDEDSHIVYNLVGTKEMSIDVGPPIELSARDTVLLASDGLGDNIHIDKIVASARCGDLSKSITTLMNQCQKVMRDGSPVLDGHPDDLTTLAFRHNTARRSRKKK